MDLLPVLSLRLVALIKIHSCERFSVFQKCSLVGKAAQTALPNLKHLRGGLTWEGVLR